MNKISLLLLAVAVFSINMAKADETRVFQVTITNLTRGQIFSPVFAITHNGDHALFRMGEPASDELAALAQDADTDKLIDLLSSAPGTLDIVLGKSVILPGHSETIMIHSDHDNRYLSLAVMLVSSNDAFMGISKIRLPKKARMISVPAYDAGAEANDESCSYIPGPPCGNADAASAVAGEGFVHIHAGIHGIGDLDAAQFDWRNPVAKVAIRRVREH